jgi:hypothetical protein
MLLLSGDRMRIEHKLIDATEDGTTQIATAVLAKLGADRAWLREWCRLTEIAAVTERRAHGAEARPSPAERAAEDAAYMEMARREGDGRRRARPAPVPYNQPHHTAAEYAAMTRVMQAEIEAQASRDRGEAREARDQARKDRAARRRRGHWSEGMADEADDGIRLGALHAKLPAAEEANNLEWPDSKSVPAFGDDDSD